MTKKKKQVQNNNNNQTGLLIIGAIIALAVIAGGIFLFTNDSAATAEVADGDATTATVELITPQEYITEFEQADKDYYLLDVRTPGEFNSGHIAGADNISSEVLMQNLSSIPTDKPIVLYCRSGNRSGTAAQQLKDAGFTEIYDIAGGTNAWSAAGLPLQ